jgi:putative transcriptional regulator
MLESLAGFFLIATSNMPDPRFAQRVIYMCSHQENEGAMGFIVNQPVPEITLAEVFLSMNLQTPEFELPNVYMGGPVEMDAAFFLHSSEYKSSSYMEVNDIIRVSRDPQILKDIAEKKGPKEYRFLLGYAGWAPGQLESELMHEGWLTLPADRHDLFEIPPDRMWEKITAKYGIDINMFEDVIGTA